ncbi:MAG TPA: 30S ribosomal protein S19 [Patescibacteria group bacterium]|jgi:small subunit ribosomal protein S19
MSRSSKKGPYINIKLMKKIMKQKQAGEKSPLKTWARDSVVAPEFVGHTLLIHQGKNFVEVFVSETMVGHKLGEFAPTRTFRGHGRIVKRVLAKT